MTTMSNLTWNFFRPASLLLVSLVLLTGCMNRTGRLLNQRLASTTARQLAPLDVFEEFTGRAKVFAQTDSLGNYVFSTGSGDFGFGFYNLDSGDFYSGRQVLSGANGIPGKNFLGSDPGSISAMALAGRFFVVSGSQGLTQIDVSNKANPFVFRHLPERVQVDSPLYKYQWSAMVAVNNGTTLFGFNRNRMFGLDISGFGQQALIPAENPMNQDLSCGRGATEFRGKIYLAGCSKLLRFDSIDQSGMVNLESDFPYLINAQQVFSTSRYLYVYHVPVNGRESVSSRAGIYVFDINLRQVNFIPVAPMQTSNSFSVSADDQFLFSNDTDEYISIYRIPWTNSF